MTRNIRQMWPACEVSAFLIADGGEGTLKAVEQCLPVNRFTCQVHGPLGNLYRVARLDTSSLREDLQDSSFVLACDVQTRCMVRRALRMCMLRKREPLPSKLLFLTKAYVPMLMC
nr:glycerate kinase [uncultured Bacteroides sp.]